MQLHQDVRFLAGDTADNVDVFDEDLEDVQTSEEPVLDSFMAALDGASTDKVISGLGPMLSPQRNDIQAIDAVELSRLLTEPSERLVATVVVDCRPYLAYSASHIVGAHNVCYPSLLERRRLRRQAGCGGRVPPVPLEYIIRSDEIRQAVVEGRCRRVVVHDEDSKSVPWPLDAVSCCRISSGSQLISVLRSLADCTSCELHFLQGQLLTPYSLMPTGVVRVS